jgi:hypothetical protein
VASRFDDPGEADRLVEAIAAGGVNGAAEVFGVKRLTIWRWERDASDELRARIEAAKAEHDRGRAGVRGVVSDVLGSSVPRTMRRVVEVEVMASTPLDPCEVASDTHVTLAELQSIHARNVRDPDSPGHRESLRILSALLFGPIMVRERRAAEAIEIAPPPERVQASQSRGKVLEILGRSKAAT